MGARKGKALALVLIMIVGACASPESVAKAKAEEVWKRYEKVFMDLQEGRDVRDADFDEACRFFYRLTKIEIPSDHNPFLDCVPNADSHKALVSLREWYSRNHDRLYWDNLGNEVRLRPE